MNTFPIPDELAEAYKGTGHAIAAIKDGRVVDLLYLRDLLLSFSDHDEDGNGIARHVVAARLADARLGPSVRHLETLGDVSLGLCSCWEFNEL